MKRVLEQSRRLYCFYLFFLLIGLILLKKKISRKTKKKDTFIRININAQMLNFKFYKPN